MGLHSQARSGTPGCPCWLLRTKRSPHQWTENSCGYLRLQGRLDPMGPNNAKPESVKPAMQLARVGSQINHLSRSGQAASASASLAAIIDGYFRRSTRYWALLLNHRL